MKYRDRAQAELELEMNEKYLPQHRWRIAEWDDENGQRWFQPIKTCPLCGERLSNNHRC